MATAPPRGQSRAAILAQLRSPLAFFGLLVISVEASFGVSLARFQYSEPITRILASWMGGLFLAALLAVTILTFKVPRVMADSKRAAAFEVEFLTERVRDAVRLILEYSESSQKTPQDLLDLLDKVEKVLRGSTHK